MLVNIFASNFLSFKDRVDFSLVCNDATNEDAYFSIKKEYQKKEKEYRLNKVNAIYWANASWKTNILKIIQFIKEMILRSHDQSFSSFSMWYKPFLLSNTIKDDSDFWVDFFIWDVLYSYSFTIDLTTSKIKKESLLEYKSQKATTLYKRIWQKFSINTEYFSEWKDRKQFVRENSLALSVFSNMSWEISTKIRNFFKEKVHIFLNRYNIDGRFDMSDTISMIDTQNDKFNPFLQDLLIAADVNINRMDSKIEEIDANEVSWLPNWYPQDKKVKVFSNTFNHYIYDDAWNKVWDINFNPNYESTWTKALVSLSWSFYNVLENWMTLFVDELDSSLHPLLVREIVSKFNSISNANGWQLIFSTHDISLLDDSVLPKDQIRFLDKNKKWESSLYSLDDFNWINRINNISKAYLLWKFDAIPHIWQF